jgi:hypothetical protein
VGRGLRRAGGCGGEEVAGHAVDASDGGGDRSRRGESDDGTGGAEDRAAGPHLPLDPAAAEGRAAESGQRVRDDTLRGRAEAAEAAGGLEVAKGARLQHGQRDLDRTDLAVAQVEQATARLDGLAYRTALQPDADQVGVRHVLRGEQQPAAGLPRPWDVRGPSRAVTRV